MNNYQKLKMQLMPLIKGLPVITIFFVIAIFLAKQFINYTPKVYQSMAKIKLDDQKYGMSGNVLYEDFDVFSSENKIETEAEVLKSYLMVNKALNSLDFNVEIYRKGRLKDSKLYNDSPITIEYTFINNDLYDLVFNLNITANHKVEISFQEKDKPNLTHLVGELNKEISIGQNSLKIELKNGLEPKKHFLGKYSFEIFSRNKLIEDIISRLDVKAVDKEIAILRVVYKDEHPQKVADFINTLCKTYITDYVETKSKAAFKTVNFIDEKLNEVGRKMKQADLNLELFKTNNNVVNTLQETETGLREISKLRVQLINLQMNETAIIELENYIDKGIYFDETAINFGFGDLLMTELVKNLKLHQDKRHDLLIKYTEDYEGVIAVDKKIEDCKKYIKEGIKRNLKEIEVKRSHIELKVDSASHMFDNLPTREKKLHILEREFRIQEEVYNFLSRKKIEAAIASSALISFHRIIQPAIPSPNPVSPNNTLITFISGLLGLIGGIAFVYFISYARARVITRDDIEKYSTIPVAGIIRSKNTSQDFKMLINSLLIKDELKISSIISITSSLSDEGKSFVAFHFSQALLSMGYSVCFLDSNIENPQNFVNLNNWGELDKKKKFIALKIDTDHPFSKSSLNLIQPNFDFIIIDSAACTINVSGIKSMKLADLSLFVVRSNHTSISYMSQPDLIKDEFNLKNMKIVLNDANKASNYSGNFIGKRFRYSKNSKNTLITLIHKILKPVKK